MEAMNVRSASTHSHKGHRGEDKLTKQSPNNINHELKTPWGNQGYSTQCRQSEMDEASRTAFIGKARDMERTVNMLNELSTNYRSKRRIGDEGVSNFQEDSVFNVAASLDINSPTAFSLHI
ncbi:hypothetical protein [Muribaculum gordoncarteri]|uniref:hypothetical protein n=1 Tax=Muribaculum gordoncarteri TaxID=2530390 RepID=UPI003F67B52B